MTTTAGDYRAGGGGFDRMSGQQITEAQRYEMNVNIALNANPWLGQAPDALLQLASSGMPPDVLVQQAGAMAGMQNLTEIQGSLQNMTDVGQRALYGKLTEQQQRGLATMGYRPPVDADRGVMGAIGGSLGAAAPVLNVLTAPVRAVASIPVPGTDATLFSGAMDMMTWVADVPGHLYRTIRQMEGWQQWVALGVGVAAMAALPFAAPALLGAVGAAAGGGAFGTLATMGAYGLTGLAAGAASTGLTSVQSFTEWWDIANPFGATGISRGERIFNSTAKRNAREILAGAPHIDALARDVATNIDLYDVIEDFADERDASSITTMTRSLEQVATDLADPGTPEYEKIYTALQVLIEQPEFREAVDVLQRGKISYGRDAAHLVGLEQGDTFHGLVSGAVDAVGQLALDPFLLVGAGSKMWRMARHGIPAGNDVAAVERLSHIIRRDPRVNRTIAQVMTAVTHNDIRAMPRQYRRLYMPLTEFRTAEAKAGKTFETTEDFIEYITQGTNIRQLLAGKGTIAGKERIIFSTRSQNQGMGRFFEEVRRFGAGMDDVQLDNLARYTAKKLGVAEEFDIIVPAKFLDAETHLGWRNIANASGELIDSISYKTGRVVGNAMVKARVGSAVSLIGNITTMIPEGSVVALAGEGSEEGIVRFVETMGRHFNMPSYARQDWLNTIINQGTVGQRRAAASSFMDSALTAAGMRTTDELNLLTDEIIGNFNHAFGLGGADVAKYNALTLEDAAGELEQFREIGRIVGTLPVQHQAFNISVPDLRAMSKMAYNGRFLKHAAKLTDSDLAAQAMSRYIKPGWLLRIGFIPRAAGEEALAWMFRMTEGGVMQEFAALSQGKETAYREALAKLYSEGMSNLSPEEVRALNYQVVSHMRPLAYMLRRNKALLPSDHLLVRYSDFMREFYAKGLSQRFNTAGWNAYDEPAHIKEIRERIAAREVSTIEVQNAYDVGGLDGAFPEVVAPKVSRYDRGRMARYESRQAILLGKEKSARRMLLNGTQPGLKNHAENWILRHSDAVMRSTGTANAALFEHVVVNPDKELQSLPNARDPKRQDVRIVTTTGERELLANGDDYFENGVHAAVQQVFMDDIVGPILRKWYPRFLDFGETFPTYKVQQMYDAVSTARRVEHRTSQDILLQMLTPSEENLDGLVFKLQDIADRTGNPVVELVAIATRRAKQKGTFTIDGLITELKKADEELRLMDDTFGPNTEAIQGELESMREVIAGLDVLDDEERARAAMHISMELSTEGGYYDLTELRNVAENGVPSWVPTASGWRGVKDRSTVVEMPDGSLRMYAMPHEEWGGGFNLSTSIEREQAMRYAVSLRGVNSPSTRGFGALIEFDRASALDNMGVTWEDVLANPIDYANADPTRGRGAYLIGHTDRDANELAFFFGHPTNQAPMSTTQRESVRQLAAVIDTPEYDAVVIAEEEVLNLRRQLEAMADDGSDTQQWLYDQYSDALNRYNLILENFNDTHAATIDAARLFANTELTAAGSDAGDFVEDINRAFSWDDPTRPGSGPGDALMDDDFGDRAGAAARLREEAAKPDVDLADFDTRPYIEIPPNRWKIHNEDSMQQFSQEAISSASRHAPYITPDKVSFKTAWGQGIEEYWGQHLRELEDLADYWDQVYPLNKRVVAKLAEDFTFASIRNMPGHQAKEMFNQPVYFRPEDLMQWSDDELSRAGYTREQLEELGEQAAEWELQIPDELVNWLFLDTGDPNFPTEWDAMIGELNDSGMNDLDFWYDFDDYFFATLTGKEVPRPKTRGMSGNFLQSIREGLSLRGAGGLPMMGAGPEMSGFVSTKAQLKQAIETDIANALMMPDNQQWTRVSEHMLKTDAGTPVVKPIAEGTSRLYTPVMPHKVDETIQELITNFSYGVTEEILGVDVYDQVRAASQAAGAWQIDPLDQLQRALSEDDPLLALRGMHDWNQVLTDVAGLLEYAEGAMPAAYQNLYATLDAFRHSAGRVENPLDAKRMIEAAIGAGDERPISELFKEATGTDIDAFMRQVREMFLDAIQPKAERVARRIHQSRAGTKYLPLDMQQIDTRRGEELIQQALLALAVSPHSMGVSRPIAGLAFGDPRLARYITGMLAGTPMDLGVSHLLLGQVDVPRRAVEGNVGKWIEGVAERDGRYTLGSQYHQQIEVVDGSKLTQDSTGRWQPGASWEQAVHDFAKRSTQHVDNVHSRGVRHEFKALPQASGKTNLARRSGSSIVPIEPGETFTEPPDMFELGTNGRTAGVVKGFPIGRFQSERTDNSEEMMWKIIGPMLRDQVEQANGFAIKTPYSLQAHRRLRDKLKPTMPIDTELDAHQYKILGHSSVNDVRNEPNASLPDVTVGMKYRNLPNNMWDRFVRWGFDKVVGPSVDALVRKPMSFHYYVQAAEQNKTYMAWLLDKHLFNQLLPVELGDVIGKAQSQGTYTNSERAAIRTMAEVSFNEDLSKLDDEGVHRWVVGLAEDDIGLEDMIDQSIGDLERAMVTHFRRVVAPDAPNFDMDHFNDVRNNHPYKLVIEDLKDVARRGHFAPMYQLPDHIFGDTPVERFVNAYLQEVPEDIWRQGQDVAQEWIKDNVPYLPSEFSRDQWQLLQRGVINMRHVLNDLDEISTVRAINNIVPFLDSHEQRSMFAEYGRNFLPFWYAEENFIKRWGRTIALDGLAGGLANIRKAQLMYGGIRSGGVVRTDTNGKDWFVYPGSGLLSEAVDKVWFGKDTLPIGVLMQASTDSMLPGINNEFGDASFSPLVAVPLNAALQMFPETQDLRRSLIGDVGMNRNIVKQFVPGVLSNMWDAAFATEETSAKYSSAMMTAIAFMEANEQGLPEGATPDQIDEYLDKVRNHTRIILMTQAITGYFVPGAPSGIATNEDAGSFGWLTGLGVDDPSAVVRDVYRGYLANMGVSEGTAAFLRAFPNSDLEDIVRPNGGSSYIDMDIADPLAFTTSMSESISGAPLPATRVGLQWYTENDKWVNSMPDAGAWFLPPDDAEQEFDYYSYSQQLTSGLRKRRTPQEFIRAIKYRQGADVYFANRDVYETTTLRIGDNSEAKRTLDARWGAWKEEFMAAHPIFAEELSSTEAINRRARTREQLRNGVQDTHSPASPNKAGIAEMVDAWDTYEMAREVLTVKRDEESRAKLRALKLAMQDWVMAWQLRHPTLERLWSSVYEPEADLS